MKPWFCTISILWLLVLGTTATAQVSTLRKKNVAGHGIIRVDTLSIVPGSFVLAGLDSSYFALDAVNAILTWKKQPGADSVWASYRVFPFRLTAPVQRYSYDSVRNNFVVAGNAATLQQPGTASLFNFGKVNYNGSFGRSLSFGNAQDAVFNSAFNLQMSGYLRDSIEIAAALTDNNIPIQPDGTTQQLNEFDQVWLMFRKHNWEINLGDIDLRRNSAYFLSFYKRLQGASYQQEFMISPGTKSKATIAGAIAKGKFARNSFQGTEGNQGPYRLQGNNNELYFVILAGTEKVFIDGVQMQRGEDQDYVINYNTAELTFTPKQMITKDKRIQVEFEYADRNYLNYMIYGASETAFGKKFSLQVSAYSNVDARNSPINQTLDNPQKQFLSNLGDSIQNAYYPYASIDSFSVNKILYAKTDTTYNGTTDSIYVYSTDPAVAKYSLSFLLVGDNKGNYVPLFNAANGQVFQWVQPVDGIPQGNYEAATFLVSPKKQQVLSVGGTFTPDAYTTVSTELAASLYDVNTFSSKQKGNDKGYGAKINAQRIIPLRSKGNNPLQLTASAGYEWVDQNFNPVERLRAVEFYRDWGLPIILTKATEKLPAAGLQLQDAKGNSLQYQYGSYTRSDGFSGTRNSILANHTLFGWQLNGGVSLTNSNTPVDKGFFLRPTASLSKTFSRLHNYSFLASYALEHNENRNIAADTVTPQSFAFEVITASVRSDASKNNRWSFTYFTRSDKLPAGTALLKGDRSHNYSLQTELLNDPRHQLRLNLTYRQLLVNDAGVSTATPENSLLGRTEYSINVWKGLLRGNALYELGAGQESKRTFSYVEVPAGQGQFAWLDYNNDGIPQLNEFVLAIYPDQAKYIRVYTPVNEYIRASYTQFNYAFTINPKLLESKVSSRFLKQTVMRMMLQSSLQAFAKQVSDGNPMFNPFKGSVQDTGLLNLNIVLNNTLSYNRYSTSWGIDLTNLRSSVKSLLTYGTETAQVQEWTLKGRVNVWKAWTIELVQKTSAINLYTPSFKNRNYAINAISTEPRITYTAGTLFRVQAGYQYTSKENEERYGGETARFSTINLEGKYNTFSNTSLTGRFTYSDIRFTGEPNSTVSYIMLEALQPGKNYIWNLDLTKRFINSLELSFEYEGRKPASGNTINIGRVSLRVLL